MNCYRITSKGHMHLGQVWAITPGAAVIRWVLNAASLGFRAMSDQSAERVPDTLDELAQTHESVERSREFLRSIGARCDMRYAYKVAHHYAREERDMMGELNGRNL